MPENYSFSGLHVAIQDANGLAGLPLHEFRLLDATERHVRSIGIPTDGYPSDRPVMPGWQMPLSKLFDQRNWHAPPATYAYDFGDDWRTSSCTKTSCQPTMDTSYPRCVAGEGRCPPEDCGGVHGDTESGGLRSSHGEVRRSEATLEGGIRAPAIRTAKPL